MSDTPLNPDALANLRLLADRATEEVRHAVIEPDILHKLLDLAVAQPVVNSVEELDALPHGTVIMATGGQPNPDYPELFLKAGYEWSPWQALDPSDRDDGENMESSGSILKWRCDGKARVLYRPEAPGA